MPFTFKNAQKAVSLFLLVGLFFFIAVLVLIGKGSDLFTFKDSYYTLYDEGYGLSSGMTIKYKGINVGKIKKLTLTPDEQKIKLEVLIFSDYRNLIKEDAVLKVQPSLLGGANIILLSSPDSGGKVLPAGSEIFSSDMEKGQEIMQRIMESSPKKEDLTGKIKEILDYVAELKPVINSTLVNVRDSTASLKSILSGLKGTENTALSDKLLASLDNVKTMTKNFKDLSTELNSEDNTIGAIVKDKKKLFKKLDSTLDSIDASLKNVKNLSDKFKDLPDDAKRTIILLNDNLIESKKVLTGLKNVLGGEKETDKNIKSGGRN
jgi:phospholipid/cholesterol/gamma-HCH transport system substrate-binding protein